HNRPPNPTLLPYTTLFRSETKQHLLSLPNKSKKINQQLNSKEMAHQINTSEASIYVGTYGKYNAGSIFGKWLNLSDYADKEEFRSEEHTSELQSRENLVCR